jgi:serine/threonine protein kinase
MTEQTPERFRRADALFDAALDLPTGEQEAYVVSAAGDDTALLDDVRQLLAAHRASGDFLENAAQPDGVALLRDTWDASTASTLARVGPFRVVREIGRGGMGAVYLAERDDAQFEQRVALKVVRGLGADASLVRRFREERRILARLEHRHIARLLDGGVTDDGTPWFAMEYVEGERIDRWCDARSLSIDARLRLFAATCEAVQYAHSQLVVHRDLKPSNIMVTAAGELKLLDFGVAKLLSAEDVDVTYTAIGMTPQYAAPEQVRAQPVTTATDVYALGVLLYELLTGKRPYDVSQRSPAEIERIVCTTEPPRPSATLGGDDASDRAGHRATTPERLQRRLRGDLDTIVAKAMKKDPAERYPTVAALAEDLRRSLQHESITARPDSPAYHAAKFVRRHRGGVVLAAAVVVGIVIVTLREHRLRNLAEAETRTARSVEQYLLTVFGTADPFLPNDTSAVAATARELLDRGSARLDTALATEPHVRSRLRTALGRVYANLGLYDQSSHQLERALSEQRALSGDRNVAGAAILDELGLLRDRQGRIEEADSLLGLALERHRRASSPDSAIATTLEHLSEVRRERNDFPAAEALIREALAIRRSLHGDSSVATSISQQMLAEVLHDQGNDKDAAPLFRAALATRERQLGRDHPLVAKTLFNLALTERRLGQIAVSESLYRRTLDIQQRTLGEDHPAVASTLNGLADLLHKAAARSDEAELLLRQALVINRRRLGEQHVEVSTNLGNLAVILRERGDYAGAEVLLRQALAIDEATFGPEHSYVAYDLNELATILRMRGKPDSATPIFRRVLATNRRIGGEGHRNTVAVKVQLGRALREGGKFEEAADVFREALTHLRPDNPDTDPFTIGATIGHGRSLVRLGKKDEGLALLQAALVSSTAKFGADNYRTAEAHLGLGECFIAMGRMTDARTSLDAAWKILEPQRRAQPVLAAEVERELRRLPPLPGARRPLDAAPRR